MTQYSKSMGILDVSAGKESQLINAAIYSYQRGDLHGAIGYVMAQNRLLNPPVELPAMPPVYGKPASAQIRTQTDYYFKILQLVNDASRSEFIRIRKELKGPMVRVVDQAAPPVKAF